MADKAVGPSVAHQHHPAVGDGHHLGKAEDRRVTERTERPATVTRQQGMRAVLDQLETALLTQLADGVNRSRESAVVDQVDRCRRRPDASGNIGGVDAQPVPHRKKAGADAGRDQRVQFDGMKERRKEDFSSGKAERSCG